MNTDNAAIIDRIDECERATSQAYAAIRELYSAAIATSNIAAVHIRQLLDRQAAIESEIAEMSRIAHRQS